MVGAAAHRDLLLPRPPGGMGAGALLALIVHAGLIAALAFSVRWRTSEPEGVEAELWAAVPQVAAPEPKPAPPPEPKPVPPPEPKPAPPPPEPKPEPPAVPKAEPPPDAQIAIERERRERLKREAEEQAAREKAERERIERERAEREKAEREKAEREKAEREKAEREKIAREKAEREKAERERREAEKLAQLREENLQRMRELAGETRPSTGTAATTAGPSASYAGRIRARVKPNIVFTDIVSGNPVAVVEVRAAPDGTIVGRRLVKSSGVPAWDEAVLRAIDKTEVLPRDTDGRVPSPIEIAFRARE